MAEHSISHSYILGRPEMSYSMPADLFLEWTEHSTGVLGMRINKNMII